jgi:biopolymer transport protein ExbB/TolQ
MKHYFSFQTTAQIVIINMIAFALLYMFWLNSWVHLAIAADPTGIVFVIAAVLLWGLYLSLTKAIQLDKEINNLEQTKTQLGNHTHDSLTMRFTNRLQFIQLLSSSTIMLGLIGTILGFIIGLYGITPESLYSIDLMTRSIAQILSGMSVAFYTTLVGCMANLWLEFNTTILNQGLVKLYYRLVNEDVHKE